MGTLLSALKKFQTSDSQVKSYLMKSSETNHHEHFQTRWSPLKGSLWDQVTERSNQGN